jgi:hypothetical protein
MAVGSNYDPASAVRSPELASSTMAAPPRVITIGIQGLLGAAMVARSFGLKPIAAGPLGAVGLSVL